MNFSGYLEGLLSGKPQSVFLDEFGNISWQIEEATFLRLSGNLSEFYRELGVLVKELLSSKGATYEHEELSEVLSYQFTRIASLDPTQPREWHFSRNLPEYFDQLMSNLPADIQQRSQTLTVSLTGCEDNKEDNKVEFARQVIWFGRRDCRTLRPATWY